MKKVIPINVDVNVSPSFYNKYAIQDQLLVTNMFYTFQGEGPFTGHPAVFLRLAGCNIGSKIDCDFCDTKFEVDKGTEWGAAELARKLVELAGDNAKLLVITGGEPLLQEKTMSLLIQKLEKMRSKGASPFTNYQIETNGMYLKEISFMFWQSTEYLPNVHVVISPKAVSSQNRHATPKPTWFRSDKSANSAFKTYLKYVISADMDSLYYRVPDAVLVAAKESGTPLYVSGMAHYIKSYPDGKVSSIWNTEEMDHTQTALNYRRTAEYALEHGLIVSYQQHIFGAVE